ncbi:hypothetical protein [Neorhizobium sp. S3-V5DH]|uniref:hypothetical protein n=1 Tax=Neorhizobium sp. S3-V5DH TaxID=2485166 RepID=UPI0010DE15DD|nr:hypothetical protein [Neorhizobium sp. S3-V5DH]TCV62321.1 hypothetical protein EDE09_12486 [Neorhizobium sp. S3-V5DH]
MIGRKLRQFYTSCSMVIASPEPSGSVYTMRKPLVCYGPSLAGMLSQKDREAMQKNLTDKYGITQIEAAE